MKMFKRLMSVVIVVLMVLTTTACHGKDEVALTVNDIEIKSALYINALLEADSEARTRVDETMEEDTSGKEIDYFSQTLDGMSYSEYVKSQAIEHCKEYAFYQTQANEGKLKLTDEEIQEAEYYAEMYWSYYGYKSLYEANGISLDTYKKAYTYSYYANALFLKRYGEGGEKEVSKQIVKDTMLSNFQLVYTLSETYPENATDTDKKTVKAKLQGYADRLEKGESFEKIYKEVNPDSTTQSSTNTEDGPKDQYATVIGSADTSYADDNFDTLADMKKGETKVISSADETGAKLYVKLDISEDEYYLTTLTETILYMLKEEEFNTYTKGLYTDYNVKENKFATNRFKVKKLVYPES